MPRWHYLRFRVYKLNTAIILQRLAPAIGDGMTKMVTIVKVIEIHLRTKLMDIVPGLLLTLAGFLAVLVKLH